MRNYLYTLLQEKGIDIDDMVTVDHDELFGDVFMHMQDIINFICRCDRETQEKIRKTFIMIDFKNGDVMDYIKFIGKGIVNNS